MTDVRELKSIKFKFLKMKIWLETDGVRQTEEQRDRLGREVIKLGPKI